MSKSHLDERLDPLVASAESDFLASADGDQGDVPVPISLDVSFYPPYKQPGYEGLVVKDKPIVETAGYISPYQQIENLLLAGERLMKYRAEHYDFNGQFPDPTEGDLVDPTREQNFDMADASQMALQTNDALKAQKDAHMRRRAQQKALLAQREAKDKADLEAFRAKERDLPLNEPKKSVT